MTDKNGEEGIELIGEQGGYQLYLLPDDIPRDNDACIPIISKTLLDSNDKVKIMVQEYEEGKIIPGDSYSSEDPLLLQRCVDYVFKRLDDSGVSEKEREDRTLEEVVEFLKQKREELGSLCFFVDFESDILDNLPIARGHDNNYARVSNGALGVHHLEYPLLFSIPEELLNKRTCVDEEYWRQHQVDDELGEILSVGVPSWDYETRMEKTDSFYRDVREKKINPKVLEEISQRINSGRMYHDFTPQKVKEIIVSNLDYLSQEIKRHETTLDIINYLKLRVQE